MTNLFIIVTSDLFNAGRTEDGTEFHAERYLVWAGDIDGTRYEHNSCFNGVKVHPNEEDGGSFFEDVREDAIAQAEKLAARVRAHIEVGGGLDMQYWREIDPVYGSAAYINNGVEGERAFQERQDG